MAQNPLRPIITLVLPGSISLGPNGSGKVVGGTGSLGGGWGNCRTVDLAGFTRVNTPSAILRSPAQTQRPAHHFSRPGVALLGRTGQESGTGFCNFWWNKLCFWHKSSVFPPEVAGSGTTFLAWMTFKGGFLRVESATEPWMSGGSGVFPRFTDYPTVLGDSTLPPWEG